MLLDEECLTIGRVLDGGAWNIFVESYHSSWVQLMSLFSFLELQLGGVILRDPITPDFAWKDWLFIFGSLILSPPTFLGRQTFFQVMRAHLFMLPLHLQRKDVCRFFIALKTHLGESKTEERYRGKDWRTDLKGHSCWLDLVSENSKKWHGFPICLEFPSKNSVWQQSHIEGLPSI